MVGVRIGIAADTPVSKLTVGVGMVVVVVVVVVEVVVEVEVVGRGGRRGGGSFFDFLIFWFVCLFILFYSILWW